MEEGRAVGPVRDPMIHQDDGAAIRLPADQAAEALLQAQHRLGQRQLSEGISERGAARQLQWVTGNPEWQAHDHHARERVARHVDAFPEAAAAETDATRMLLEL